MGPGGGAGGPQANMQKMAADLNLTEDQKPKFQSAMRDHGQKMQKLRSNTSLSQDDKNKQITAARQALAKKMHGILTQDQFQKWQEELRSMHPPGGQGGGGVGGPGGMGGPPPGGQGNRYGSPPADAPPPAGPTGGYPSNGVPPAAGS